jgi:hypothetical protein
MDQQIAGRSPDRHPFSPQASICIPQLPSVEPTRQLTCIVPSPRKLRLLGRKCRSSCVYWTGLTSQKSTWKTATYVGKVTNKSVALRIVSTIYLSICCQCHGRLETADEYCSPLSGKSYRRHSALHKRVRAPSETLVALLTAKLHDAQQPPSSHESIPSGGLGPLVTTLADIVRGTIINDDDPYIVRAENGTLYKVELSSARPRDFLRPVSPPILSLARLASRVEFFPPSLCSAVNGAGFALVPFA